MDCNLFFAENEDSSKQIISANDWIDMDSFEFLKRVCVYDTCHLGKKIAEKEKYLKKISKRVRLIRDDEEKILGRGTLDVNFEGLLSVGGIRASSTSLFVGVLQGMCSVANRFSARPIVSHALMKSWLEEQASLLSNDLSWQEYDPELEIAALLRSFDIPTGPLTVAYYRENALDYEQVKEIIRETRVNKYVVFYGFSKKLIEDVKVSYNKNVFWSKCGYKPISSCYGHNGDAYFINSEFPSIKRQKELVGIIAEACADVWHEGVKDIETCSTDKKPIYEIVGTSADGEKITRHCHSVIERKSVKAESNPVKKTSKKNSTKKKAKK